SRGAGRMGQHAEAAPRSAGDALRAVPAQVQPGRAAPAVERAARGHEPGGPAADDAEPAVALPGPGLLPAASRGDGLLADLGAQPDDVPGPRGFRRGL